MDISLFAHMFAQAAIQKASYQISDLYNKWPNELRVFFLISAQSFVRSVTPMLSEDDQELVRHILDHTETIVLPGALDPRKRGEGGTDNG